MHILKNRVTIQIVCLNFRGKEADPLILLRCWLLTLYIQHNVVTTYTLLAADRKWNTFRIFSTCKSLLHSNNKIMLETKGLLLQKQLCFNVSNILQFSDFPFSFNLLSTLNLPSFKTQFCFFLVFFLLSVLSFFHSA